MFGSNMAASAGVYRLLPAVAARLSGTVSHVRPLCCSAGRSQRHRAKGTGALTGTVDRFGGVTVNLSDGLPEDISERSFSGLLKGETAPYVCYYTSNPLYVSVMNNNS